MYPRAALELSESAATRRCHQTAAAAGSPFISSSSAWAHKRFPEGRGEPLPLHFDPSLEFRPAFQIEPVEERSRIASDRRGRVRAAERVLEVPEIDGDRGGVEVE